LLILPVGVEFLAADDYPHIGTVPLDSAHLCSGLYYHAAWDSTYTNQLSEMVGPALFYDQIRKFSQAAKATSVFVLNVSDLLPVLMAAELILKYIWNPNSIDQFGTVADAEAFAVTDWAVCSLPIPLPLPSTFTFQLLNSNPNPNPASTLTSLPHTSKANSLPHSPNHTPTNPNHIPTNPNSHTGTRVHGR
jgi:hypothetical protein